MEKRKDGFKKVSTDQRAKVYLICHKVTMQLVSSWWSSPYTYGISPILMAASIIIHVMTMPILKYQRKKYQKLSNWNYRTILLDITYSEQKCSIIYLLAFAILRCTSFRNPFFQKMVILKYCLTKFVF